MTWNSLQHNVGGQQGASMEHKNYCIMCGKDLGTISFCKGMDLCPDCLDKLINDTRFNSTQPERLNPETSKEDAIV